MLVDYKVIIEKIQKSLKYKLGYPSSLMSMLHGRFTDDGVVIDDTYTSNRLISNKNIDYAASGFYETFTNNVGDPWENSKTTDSHETKFIEIEVIKILGKYFGLNENEVRGYVTSGGTESNMAAIWWAKRRLTIQQTDCTPLVLAGNSCHYSISKICNIMNLKLELIGCDSLGNMSIEHLNSFLMSLDEQSICKLIVVVTVGSTVTGSIDDLVSIKKTLRYFKNKISRFDYIIHIDGALNGITIPILKPFGNIKNYFDELDVSTIAISGHKFLGTPVCGVVLTKNAFLDLAFPYKHCVEYCGDIKDITVSGSRPGINSVLLLTTLHAIDLHTNTNKLEKIIYNNLKNAEYLYINLINIVGKLKVFWIKNQFNVLFPKPSYEIIRKYQLMPTENNMCVACVLLNVTKNLIDSFIDDYKKDSVTY